MWQTRAALLGYSVGLLGLIVVKILAPGFYARQNMRTPVKIAFLTVLVAQTLAVILMFQIGHAGLTLSTSLGACFNATLLYRRDAARRHLCAAMPGWSAFSLRVARRAAVLGAVLWLAAGRRRILARTPDCGRRSAGSLGASPRGAVAYFATLWLLGFRLADFNRHEPS